MSYYFDSYALVEILKGNRNYSKYEEEILFTSAANLGEVRYYTLRSGEAEKYEKAISRMRPDLLETTRKDWEKAAETKYLHRERKLSLVDCLGYHLALKNQLRFLTGDQGFRNLEGVEFVQ